MSKQKFNSFRTQFQFRTAASPSPFPLLNQFSSPVETFFSEVNNRKESLKNKYFEPVDISNPYKAVENFFNTYVNPPEKKESDMCLADELEWAVARGFFNKLEVNSNARIHEKDIIYCLHEYLG
ncbi:MAG: hypothetical protein ACLFQV_04570 [Vulcanimicrobiota bacterium]